jgi:acyl carrier protein
VVAFRGRQRFVRAFEPVRLRAAGGAAAGLVHGGVYLIAGAADGPGMSLADHLVRRLEAKVGLVLPGGFPRRERWESWQAPADLAGDDAIGAAVRRLLDLERACGLERVLILRSDDPAAVGGALAEVRARFGPLSGAVWTGGALPGGLLQLKTPESLHAALAPLARGAEALLAAVAAVAAVAADAERTGPPPFVLLSSTTTALTGGVGQLELAAAGSYLEALAASRQPACGETGGTPIVAVHWDPYQWESWLAAGVAGGMTNLSAEEAEAGLRAHGVAAERSAAALARLLAGLPGAPAVAVTARDLPGLIAEVDSVTAETLLAQLAAGHAGTAERPALRTAYAPPEGELEERIAAIWQDLFGIAPIGRDDSFLELGGHSLLAIQIVTRLRDVLAVDLPVTALFEAPTVGLLARAVRQEHLSNSGESDPDELEALLALVEGLSPEEAAARLAEL